MRLVCGLIMMMMMMMMMMHTAAGVDRVCWFNQSGPCNAAPGDKLSLQLLPNTRIYEIQMKKRINSSTYGPVCRIKDDTIKSDCDLYENRPDVTVINGTLIINSVITADSGIYTLFVHNSDGTVTSTADLQVNIEDPSLAAKVLGSLAVILIVLLSVLYFFYRKKKKKAKPPSDQLMKKESFSRSFSDRTSTKEAQGFFLFNVCNSIRHHSADSESRKRQKQQSHDDSHIKKVAGLSLGWVSWRFCVEFACSPCMGFLRVLRFPPQSKHMRYRCGVHYSRPSEETKRSEEE